MLLRQCQRLFGQGDGRLVRRLHRARPIRLFKQNGHPLGGVGTHVVQLARLVGAAPIVAVDINPEVLERALELGADHAFDNSDFPMFHPQASALAWERTVEFLGRRLPV